MEYIIKEFLLFLTYSFIGWVCEVIYCSFPDKKFVNRGFLRVCQVKCVSFFRYHKRRCVTSDCWL
ncbi:putative ABC transporter permease [Megasphaera cerevisiae]|uniref:putative ABC transporter permease n=1 Tax=Megasphaera cerevisiae TaxID=39029 RepID=UPI0009459D43|nr:hypothetical protein BSR42_13950 [Megasphaera cerevisiae]